MNFDDVIYISLLISSIVFGHYYRTLQTRTIEQKKIIGLIAGLFIITIVSGIHVWHCFLIVTVNALIVTWINKRYCHVLSFSFCFLYLLFFRCTTYFGLSSVPAHTNLIQMILTLKMVGLALEVSDSSQDHKGQLRFKDVYYYAFNFIGVLTGPYYRYKTFRDYFEKSFAQYSPWFEATKERLQYVPLYAVLFLWGTYNWPLSYALGDEFYTERSWLYRFWYCWPNFFIFRMRIYIGIVLSECVCTAAGFGCYPKICEPIPGEGPTKNLEELELIANNPARIEVEKFDFETVRNIRPYNADFCTTVREGMKHWNCCVQYWLVVNVYKRFPSKKFRTLVTMFVSAFWHGIYLGHWVCIGSVPFYLVVEDVWVNILLKRKDQYSKVWEWVLLFAKMQAFSYMAIAFHLLTLQEVIKYYGSVYHIGTIANLVLFLTGIWLQRRLKVKKTER